MLKICALCEQNLSAVTIQEGDNGFCCHGCHAVFQILSVKNQIENYKSHPIFTQAVHYGLISNPVLLEQIEKKQASVSQLEVQKMHLEISEMWCPACAEVIHLILLQEQGVRSCVVDYATDIAIIEFYPRHLSKDRIFQIIHSLGYKPSNLNEPGQAVNSVLFLRFIVAAFCSLNVMMFAYPIYSSYFNQDTENYALLFAWISFFASLPVMTYSAWPILQRCWTSFKVGLYGMELLVTISVSTAFLVSFYTLLQGSFHVYFDSFTVIITFVLLGKIIESKAKFSSKNTLMHIIRSLPRKARKLLADGTSAFVAIKDISMGDTIVVYSGEKIVVDGIVVNGEGICDESFMTGEVIPIQKSVGSSVLGGSILQNGKIEIRVTTSCEASALHKIIAFVQQELNHKSFYVRTADVVVQWFVPMVLSIALLTGIVVIISQTSDAQATVAETAWMRALAVLLISCPCAIGIAVPLAEAQIINKLMQLGTIVRNRGALALLGKETVFVFDKTGTITEGHFKVLDGLERLSQNECVLLKSIAEQSNHPISRAIVRSIDIPAAPLDRVEEVIGFGLRALHQGMILLLGSEQFLKQNGVEIPFYTNSNLVQSRVYFSIDGQCKAEINLGDRIRPGVQETLKELAPAKTVLLSGDAEASVVAVAKLCQFDEWKSSCTPLQKQEYIKACRKLGSIVCMIGDGINDAPALTVANIGISVVTATDLSIQVSDLLLTSERLQVIPKMRNLAKRGRRIVYQNLFFAFIYNVLGVGLAAFGWLTPLFAACAMVMSSLMVIFNSKRV